MGQFERELRTDLCRAKATNYIRHFLSLHRSLRLRRRLGLLLGFQHDLWLGSYHKLIVINPGRIKQRYSASLTALLRALFKPVPGLLVSLLISSITAMDLFDAGSFTKLGSNARLALLWKFGAFNRR